MCHHSPAVSNGGEWANTEVAQKYLFLESGTKSSAQTVSHDDELPSFPAKTPRSGQASSISLRSVAFSDAGTEAASRITTIIQEPKGKRMYLGKKDELSRCVCVW